MTKSVSSNPKELRSTFVVLHSMEEPLAVQLFSEQGGPYDTMRMPDELDCGGKSWLHLREHNRGTMTDS